MSQLAQALRAEIDRFDPTKPIGDAYAPPASWYVDPRLMEMEKHTVFSQSWQFVGHLNELAEVGDYITGNLLGKPYVVVRDDRGQVRAYYNVCAHRGTCVARGSGNSEYLVCPYHGWTYDLTGKLRKAPLVGNVENLGKKVLGLKPLPVKTWGPFVLIHFGETQPDHTMEQLEQQTQRFQFQQLKFVGRTTYEMDCNWKVFVDNYLDGGYHLPHMHKDLSAHLDIKNYRSEIYDRFSIQSCPPSTDHIDARIGTTALYAWIYPNFMINRYGPWMDTNLVLPLAHDRCAVVFDYFYQGQPSQEILNQAMADSDQVQREDMDIVNMVQTGLGSGVYKGIYAPRFEAPMYHFHRCLYHDFNLNTAAQPI